MRISDWSSDVCSSDLGASQKVAVISEQYRPQLQAAKDDTARGEIYQEADDKMVAAVKDEGLSVDAFNGINRALQQAPKLKQRSEESRVGKEWVSTCRSRG